MVPGEADADTLEAPPSAERLYHSRGDDVLLTRPILTGDVIQDIEIPGLDDGIGLAILLTHPCSMRRDGVALVERIYVARVSLRQPIPFHEWRDRHFKLMPLPDLIPSGGAHAAVFDSAGLVKSELLATGTRVACLSELGINLLQQRLIFHLTRYVAPTFKLHETCVGVFREVELHDEWADHQHNADVSLENINRSFHAWIRDRSGGSMSRQERLHDEQQAAAVRREMRAYLQA